MAITHTKDLNEETWSSGQNTIVVQSVAMQEFNIENSEMSDAITFNTGVLDYRTLSDGTLIVLGKGASIADKIEIPSVYQGQQVTEIASSAFAGNTTIREITIPKSIRRIGAEAFMGSALTKVIFEDTSMLIVFFQSPDNWGVPQISYRFGDYGDADSTKMLLYDASNRIYSCQVPADVQEIKFYSNDRNYETYPHNTADTPIGNCLFTVTTQKLGSDTYYVVETTEYFDISKDFNMHGGLQIEKGAFKLCNGLETITLPRRATLIGDEVFMSCENLMTVSFTKHHRILSIGASAFENCTALEVVTMYDGVREIGAGAFKGCYALSSCMLGDGLQKIGEEAFMNLKLLEEVTIPASVERIEKKAFYGLPPTTQVRYIMFENPNAWIASETGTVPSDGTGVFMWMGSSLNIVPPSGTHTIVWHPSTLYGLSTDDYNAQRNGDFLSVSYTDFVWLKLKKMATPQVSLSDNILSMTDPLGIADAFNIYTKEPDGSHKLKCTVRVD